jgi:23S rRNA (adenine1618-N6)-methyltransferase
MKPKPPLPQAGPAGKAELHPRNRHHGRYDFAPLVRASPELIGFLRPNPHGDRTIDFANPAAVKALNRALLRHFYGITSWDLPPGCLCPPIPGRADHLHHAADLLAADNHGTIPRGPEIAVLDIGTGANCIYPILGHHEYGWRFVASEIDPAALRNARRIVAENPTLAGFVDCRHQAAAGAIFRGIVRPGERFALTLCNPPFHASAREAAAGSQRKARNLGTSTTLNFGGTHNELWCPGGELAFVRRMIAESATRPDTALWFTTLVSNTANLPALRRALVNVRALDVRIVPMAQGQKQSRLLAWTFLPAAARHAWRERP